MPRLNGFDLTGASRRQAYAGADYLVTIADSAEDKARHEAGADAYIVKAILNKMPC
jgi:DNA-binding response OmpR family regulator